MKLKVFTLRFDPATGKFDDAEIQEFQRDRQVLTIHEHFFTYEHTPMWSILVSYRDEEYPGEGARLKDRGRDWRAELSADERSLYDALRKWRNDRSGREGRPPYILLTNKQMAIIAQKRPKTLEALRGIEGVGAAKIEAFGKEILALVAGREAGDTETKSSSNANGSEENGS